MRISAKEVIGIEKPRHRPCRGRMLGQHVEGTPCALSGRCHGRASSTDIERRAGIPGSRNWLAGSEDRSREGFVEPLIGPPDRLQDPASRP